MSAATADKSAVVVRPDDSIRHVVTRMASEKVVHHGMAVVVDDGGLVVGVFNNGDALRLLALGGDLDAPVKSVLTAAPIAVTAALSRDEMIRSVREQLRQRQSPKDYIKHLVVTDDEGRFVCVYDYVGLIAQEQYRSRRVAIIGQGFVGLTLGAALTEAGHRVTGVDVDAALVGELSLGRVHVHEPRLEDIVRASIGNGSLSFATALSASEHDVYIIAVGTPVTDERSGDLTAISAAARSVGAVLKRGDTVVVRSTVPLGTTRNVILPLLESQTALRAGEDFFLSFAPERTIEGKTMAELRELPQIVSGLTPQCRLAASAFWATLARSVIQVDSFEAAELIKLINNSFRDLSFAFANGVADLCDRFNLDTFQVIRAANEGYPRNPVPTPSPGVGGYCLTKDPFLFAAAHADGGHARLARIGREINERAAGHPLRTFEEYARLSGRSEADLTAFVIGVAFKGWPATNDLRGSTAVAFVDALARRGVRVCVWDAVVGAPQLAAAGMDAVDYNEGWRRADAVFILNNHPDNVAGEFLSACQGRAMLVYDGWAQLSAREVERLPGLSYATSGYLTRRAPA